jgi:3-oxoacyl-[acyl-carrier protein] reductase
MLNPMDMTGRAVIVTGAGQGIGRAISEMLLGLGGGVVMVERNPETLRADRRRARQRPALAGRGRRVRPRIGEKVRVAGRGAFRRGARPRQQRRHHPARHAGEDELPAVAAGDRRQPDRLLPDAAGRRPAHARARAGGAAATHGTTGSIVNISSTAGKRGSVGQVNYSAAKAGLYGMTMTAAREWAKHGVRCNSVGFGTVVTPMTETIRGERFEAQTLARIPMGRYARAAGGGAADLLSCSRTLPSTSPGRT